MKCKLILQGQISIKKLFCNKLHTDTVSYITAFDRNNIISCSFDGNVKISIVMKDGFQEKSFFKCHDGHIRKIILLENNRFASCSNGGTIRIYKDNKSYEEIIELYHSKYLCSIIQLNKNGTVSFL